MTEIKQLLNDMKKREELRNNEAEEIIAEMKRLDLREETETERFMSGMEEDRNSGIYNHITDGKFQQLINEQKTQIEERYNTQREELRNKQEEMNKKHMEEKSNDYKQISSEIKAYHLDMVLKVNEEQKKLAQIELEQKQKTQEIDDMIKQKEAEKTHLVVQNRNFMDVGASAALGEINALTLEIERLEDEKNTIANEYKAKIEDQTKITQECLQQKERASAFLSSIRLSEKSIDEIYNLLFDGESEQEQSTIEQPEVMPEPETVQEPEQEEEKEPETAQEPEQEKKKEPETAQEPEQQEEKEPETAQEPEQQEEKEPETKQEEKKEPEVKKGSESFWESIKRLTEKYSNIEQEEEEEVSEMLNPSETITKIYLSEEGTTMKTKDGSWTEKGFKKIKEETEKNLDAEVLKQAKAIGDEKIIAEICENESLSSKEKEEQLKKYTAVLSGEYTDADYLPFEINYYIKDLRKADGLDREGRKKIIDNAKKIRDINKQIEEKTGVPDALGIVDASWITKAKWFVQDAFESIKNANWFNKVKNLLPKREETKQLAAAQEKEDKMAKFRAEMAEAAKTTTEQPKEEKTETEQEVNIDENMTDEVSEEINEEAGR